MVKLRLWWTERKETKEEKRERKKERKEGKRGEKEGITQFGSVYFWLLGIHIE